VRTVGAVFHYMHGNNVEMTDLYSYTPSFTPNLHSVLFARHFGMRRRDWMYVSLAYSLHLMLCIYRPSADDTSQILNLKEINRPTDFAVIFAM